MCRWRILVMEPWSAVGLCYLLGDFAGCEVIWSLGSLRTQTHWDWVTQAQPSSDIRSLRCHGRHLPLSDPQKSYDSTVPQAERADGCNPAWMRKNWVFCCGYVNGTCLSLPLYIRVEEHLHWAGPVHLFCAQVLRLL